MNQCKICCTYPKDDYLYPSSKLEPQHASYFYNSHSLDIPFCKQEPKMLDAKEREHFCLLEDSQDMCSPFKFGFLLLSGLGKILGIWLLKNASGKRTEAFDFELAGMNHSTIQSYYHTIRILFIHSYSRVSQVPEFVSLLFALHANSLGNRARMSSLRSCFSHLKMLRRQKVPHTN